MKSHRRHSQGVTLLEVLFVVLILGILIALLMPAIARSKLRAKRAQCTSNLKQQSLAFHLFAHDHNSRFPFEVSTNSGGSLEFMRLATNFGGEIYFSFRHYQALAPELETPKILVCPTDNRVPAENFQGLRNDNLSYFISGSAIYENPMSILSGDRNIETYDLGLRSVLRLDSGDLPGWTAEMHQHQGNLLFADSHVEQVNNKGLRAALRSAPGGQTIVLAPLPAPSTSTAATSGTGGGTAGAAGLGEGASPAANSESAAKGAATVRSGSSGANSRTPANVDAKIRGGGVSRPGAEMTGSGLAANGQVVTNDSRTQGQSTSAESDAEYRPDSWPAFIAHYITTLGAKVTWLLLAVILSVLVYLEVRRRRAKVQKESQEMANVE